MRRFCFFVHDAAGAVFIRRSRHNQYRDMLNRA